MTSSIEDLSNMLWDDEFCLWAFGCLATDKVFKEELDIMNAWNALHAKELKLLPDNEIMDDVRRMKDMWNEEVARRASHK